MYLTPSEVRELTDKKWHSLQIRWLSTHGYRFEISDLGRPKVLRSDIESQSGPQKTTKWQMDESTIG